MGLAWPTGKWGLRPALAEAVAGKGRPPALLRAGVPRTSTASASHSGVNESSP